MAGATYRRDSAWLAAHWCVFGFSIALGLITFFTTYKFYNVRHLRGALVRRPRLVTAYGLISSFLLSLIFPALLFTDIGYEWSDKSLYRPINFTLHNISQSWIIFLILLILIRTWLLYFDLRFSQDTVNQTWRTHIQNDEHSIWIDTRKTLGNPRYLVICASLIASVLFVIGLVEQITEGNSDNVAAQNRFLARIGFALPVAICSLIFRCNIRSFIDEFGLRTELNLLTSVVILDCLREICLEFLTMTNMDILEFYRDTFDILFILLSTFVQTIWGRHICIVTTLALKTKNTQSGHSKSNAKMIDILLDRSGFELFIAHCQKELSIENLLFIVEIAQYKMMLVKEIVPCRDHIYHMIESTLYTREYMPYQLDIMAPHSPPSQRLRVSDLFRIQDPSLNKAVKDVVTRHKANSHSTNEASSANTDSVSGGIVRDLLTRNYSFQKQLEKSTTVTISLNVPKTKKHVSPESGGGGGAANNNTSASNNKTEIREDVEVSPIRSTKIKARRPRDDDDEDDEIILDFPNPITEQDSKYKPDLKDIPSGVVVDDHDHRSIKTRPTDGKLSVESMTPNQKPTSASAYAPLPKVTPNVTPNQTPATSPGRSPPMPDIVLNTSPIIGTQQLVKSVGPHVSNGGIEIVLVDDRSASYDTRNETLRSDMSDAKDNDSIVRVKSNSRSLDPRDFSSRVRPNVEHVVDLALNLSQQHHSTSPDIASNNTTPRSLSGIHSELSASHRSIPIRGEYREFIADILTRNWIPIARKIRNRDYNEPSVSHDSDEEELTLSTFERTRTNSTRNEEERKREDESGFEDYIDGSAGAAVVVNDGSLSPTQKATQMAQRLARRMKKVAQSHSNSGGESLKEKRKKKKRTLSNERIFDHSNYLFDKYIQIDSPLQLNLPDSMRKRMKYVLNQSTSEALDNIAQIALAATDIDYRRTPRMREIVGNYLYHIFDQPFEEIWRLLRDDTFMRFTYTPQFKKWADDCQCSLELKSKQRKLEKQKNKNAKRNYY